MMAPEIIGLASPIGPDKVPLLPPRSRWRSPPGGSSPCGWNARVMLSRPAPEHLVDTRGAQIVGPN
jgi:hypothetical protein